MKQISKIIISFLIIILIPINCSEEGKYEYYENGNVKNILIVDDNLNDSTLKQFYETGELRSILVSNLKTKSRELRYYYKTGILRKIIFSKNNLNDSLIAYEENGNILFKQKKISKDYWQYLFFKDNIKYLEQLCRLNIPSEDSIFLESEKYFDKNGEIIKGKGNYIEITIDPDTILLGNSVSIKFVLKEPFFKEETDFLHIRIYRSDCDSLIICNSSTGKYNYSYIPKDTGEYYFYGKLIEFAKKNKNGDIETTAQPFTKYFDVIK